jgi:UDP-N-acetyl-D-galactosamine dehydrogenase
VILAGRRINDDMSTYVAERTVKALIKSGVRIDAARVAVVGVTFKENIHDTRNSRVPGIVRELLEYGIDVELWDPWASADEVAHEYGLRMVPALSDSHDAIVLAVPHRGVVEDVLARLFDPRVRVLADVKGAVPRDRVPAHVRHWRL